MCLLLISGPTNLAYQLLFILLLIYLSGVCWFFLVWYSEDGGRWGGVPLVKFLYRNHFLLTDLIKKYGAATGRTPPLQANQRCHCRHHHRRPVLKQFCHRCHAAALLPATPPPRRRRCWATAAAAILPLLPLPLPPPLRWCRLRCCAAAANTALPPPPPKILPSFLLSSLLLSLSLFLLPLPPLLLVDCWLLSVLPPLLLLPVSSSPPWQRQCCHERPSAIVALLNGFEPCCLGKKTGGGTRVADGGLKAW